VLCAASIFLGPFHAGAQVESQRRDTSEPGDYAVAHDHVDIGGGRRLNLYCRGEGAPTVIFEGGRGEQSWDWRLVHPAVAHVTRACVYDRAGYGFSDRSARAATAGNAVEDLHALLTKAGIATPVTLVGHSYGGLIAQLYAYTYPKEVGGVVLVDTDHEDATTRADRVLEGKMSEITKEMKGYFENCRAAARAGIREGDKAWQSCVGDEKDVYGPVLWPLVRDQRRNPAVLDVIASEWEHWDKDSAAALRAARRPFGSLPLVYLTRGVSPYAVPGKPQSAANRAYEDDVVKAHEEITSLSSLGAHYIVPGAGHDIHIDKPQAVVDAVLAIVGMQKR
jgi:pimeloyl-ACP methyl ester carboxylesterase